MPACQRLVESRESSAFRASQAGEIGVGDLPVAVDCRQIGIQVGDGVRPELAARLRPDAGQHGGSGRDRLTYPEKEADERSLNDGAQRETLGLGEPGASPVMVLVLSQRQGNARWRRAGSTSIVVQRCPDVVGGDPVPGPSRAGMTA